MFYDIFVSLCKSRGKVPTAVLTELGMSKGNLGKWKGGRTPKTDALLKIANYFDVSIDYLTGNDQKEKPAEDDGLVNRDAELTKYLDELRNRSEMRMLFSVAKDAKKEDIEALAKFFEQMNGKKDT